MFIKDGYSFARKTGSHRIYKKPGHYRALIIPEHNKDIKVGIITDNLLRAGMSREKYFELLKKCK